MKNNFLRSGFLALLAILTVLLCGIGASAQTPAWYDAAQEGILSGYYRIDPETGFITGIAPGTSSQKLLKVCVPAGAAASTTTVVTGTTVQTADGTATATAIITGDLNGDGVTTISDMLMLKSAVLGEKLTAAAKAAGDLNMDGSVTVTDFLKAKAYLLGLDKISPAQAEADGSMLLLMPDTEQAWTVEIDHAVGELYQSDDEAVVTVSADGVIHAKAEGSAFVYVLDGQGNILARQMVTVLNEPLTVSLGETSCQIAKGQTRTLTAKFNHPVSTAVTWTSSNMAVVTVENGTLTGVDFGTATVTASLENGSKAQITVKVAPPITAIQFDRSLYKVKPNGERSISVVTTPGNGGEVFLYKSSDPSVASISADGTVTGKKYGTVTVTVTGKYSGLSASCKVKVCDVKQVAFTFDDGPAKDTSRLLDFLQENDLHVTFFLVGERLSYYPKTVQRMAREGHEIGYHSYEHVVQTKLKSSQITAEFEKSNQMLKDLTGQGFTLWRAPGGGYNDRVLSCIALPHIMWSLDSQDWVTRNATSVYNAIRNCKDGAIVLMHDLHSFTVDGAIRAMKEMNAGDYEFVTVTELLSRDGTLPENGTTYYNGR